MAASADSTPASRRAFIGGLAAVSAAVAIPALTACTSTFDPVEYLNGMRAGGSTFHVITYQGREWLGETFPTDGWDAAQEAEMLRLRALYVAEPNAKRMVADVLIREGNVYTV